MPRRSVPRPQRRRARAPFKSPPKRPKLTRSEEIDLGKKMQAAFKWEGPPRPFQLQAVCAQIEGHDMIVQAPTGSGKTAIAAGPHLHPTSKGKITIMVSPLLALEEEMVKTFQSEHDLRAIAVHSLNGGCSYSVRRKLLSEDYQVLLISPEMLQSREFVQHVLRNPKFNQRVLSLVIDEVHCVSHWGAGFRKKFGTLGIVRTFLAPGTPVLAMTATLTARARRDLMTKLHIAKDASTFVNFGNNRSNVSIIVRACEHPLGSYVDLNFVIPENLTSVQDIPKTWIYVDNIDAGEDIVDHLSQILKQRLPPGTNEKTIDDAIHSYNAIHTPEYREEAMSAFREGRMRVMVCTEAAGMGCNIPDVEVVVQWKRPKTLSNWIQRAGRVARGRNRTGIAVLLVERSAYRELQDPEPEEPPAPKKSKKKTKKKKLTQKQAIEYSEAHGILRGGSAKKDEVPTAPQLDINLEADDESLTIFIQSTTCRRKVCMSVFDCEGLSSATDPGVPCCDICDPSLFDKARPPAPIEPPSDSVKLPKRSKPSVEASDKLHTWRVEIYERDHSDAMYGFEAILSSDHIETLTSYGPLPRQAIRQLLADKWVWWEQHHEELEDFIQGLDIPYVPIASKRRKSSGTTRKPSTRKPRTKKASKQSPASQVSNDNPETPNGGESSSQSTRKPRAKRTSNQQQPSQVVDDPSNTPEVAGPSSQPKPRVKRSSKRPSPSQVVDAPSDTPEVAGPSSQPKPRVKRSSKRPSLSQVVDDNSETPHVAEFSSQQTKRVRLGLSREESFVHEPPIILSQASASGGVNLHPVPQSRPQASIHSHTPSPTLNQRSHYRSSMSMQHPTALPRQPHIPNVELAPATPLSHRTSVHSFQSGYGEPLPYSQDSNVLHSQPQHPHLPFLHSPPPSQAAPSHHVQIFRQPLSIPPPLADPIRQPPSASRQSHSQPQLIPPLPFLGSPSPSQTPSSHHVQTVSQRLLSDPFPPAYPMLRPSSVSEHSRSQPRLTPHPPLLNSPSPSQFESSLSQAPLSNPFPLTYPTHRPANAFQHSHSQPQLTTRLPFLGSPSPSQATPYPHAQSLSQPALSSPRPFALAYPLHRPPSTPQHLLSELPLTPHLPFLAPTSPSHATPYHDTQSFIQPPPSTPPPFPLTYPLHRPPSTPIMRLSRLIPPPNPYNHYTQPPAYPRPDSSQGGSQR